MNKHPLADCENCPLRRNPYVPTEPSASERAELVVIGEAPGKTEASKKRPFVGVSGKLLEAVLTHHGIKRKDVMLTNTVLCRPDKNATPSAEAVKCCSKRLSHEIESSGATNIVALGNSAATAILGYPTKITKERIGPPKQSARYPGRVVIPTIHPAACLRVPDNFPHLLSDVGKIFHAAKTAWQPPNYRVFDDPHTAKIALTQLLADKTLDPITMDLEVGVDKDEDFGHHSNIIAAGFGISQGRAIVIGYGALGSHQVRELLGRVVREKRIIAHNGKYDFGVLLNFGIGTGKLWYDTMLASYCFDERGGVHGLKYLGKELLGTPNWDDELKNDKGKKVFEPGPQLYEYNAYDCAVTYDLYELQCASFQRQPKLRELHDYLVRISNALVHVEHKGLGIDLNVMDRLTEEFEGEIEQLVDELREYMPLDKHGKEANPNSYMQVQDTLAKMGVKAYDRAKVDKPASTDEAHLVALRQMVEARNKALQDADGDAVVDFINTLLKHRGVAKLYGTYVKGIRERMYYPDGSTQPRIRTTIKIHGTTTGRVSSVNPNLLNQSRTRGIKNMYVPTDSEHVYVQADYSGIELRVVATLAKSESIRKILAEGRNINREVASTLFSRDFYNPTTYEQYHEEYVRAKSVVHGVNYGRTAHGVAEGLALEGNPVTEREAQRMIDAYLAMVPELALWQKDIKRRVLEDGETLCTPFGRQRRFMLITRENMEDIYKEALAYLPQSIASDINMHAGLRMMEEGYDVRMMVYDSVLIQEHRDKAESTGQYLAKVMKETAKEVFTDYVPFEVDVKIGPSWGDV